MTKTVNDFLNEALSDALTGLEKQASSDKVGQEVYDYLALDYPKETLGWVRHGVWERKNVDLDDIMMGRRPGGAREAKKTEALREKYENDEKMDPIVLVKTKGEGERYRIADGYHRTLAKKQTGGKKIDAFVMYTDLKEGPWLKEMHERKKSKGKNISELYQQKEASNMYLKNDLRGRGMSGLQKEANFFTGAKNFGKALWGSDARKAKEAFKGAKEFNKGVDKTIKKTFGGRATRFANDISGNAAARAGVDALNSTKHSKPVMKELASKSHKESLKTFGARAAVGGTVAGGAAIHGAINGSNDGQDFHNQRDEFEQQRRDLENR